MSDLELLQQYVCENSQPAFTALVNRHVNLVYSAAQRQVRSPQLAEEIAQSVFLILSRNAAKLSPAQPLAAWLYVVARRAAVDVVRRESRRLVRETAAAEIAAMKTPPPAWSQVECLLDDAMETLNDTERSALVLRFFENQSLREVGATLGVSEDTAQKRVSRALDRLRLFFGSRGVAVGAAALATSLSAHAVETAPSGLAAAISSATPVLPVASAAAKHLVMTTAQKALAAAIVTAALGLALYEGRAAVRLHSQVQEGQQQLDLLAETARQVRLERDAASRQLASLGRSRPPPERGSDAALEQEATAWFARINQLKQAIAQHPELSIPELQLLTEHEWLLAAINYNSSQGENVGASLRYLRTVAKEKFIRRVSDATRSYFVSAKMWPTQFDQLAPMLTPAVDPAILARYDFQSENARVVFAEKLAGAIDPDQLAFCIWEDTKTKLGLYGDSGSETASGRAVREADQAYARAHGGAYAADPAQLRPFLVQSLDTETLAKLFHGLPGSYQARTAAP